MLGNIRVFHRLEAVDYLVTLLHAAEFHDDADNNDDDDDDSMMQDRRFCALSAFRIPHSAVPAF